MQSVDFTSLNLVDEMFRKLSWGTRYVLLRRALRGTFGWGIWVSLIQGIECSCTPLKTFFAGQHKKCLRYPGTAIYGVVPDDPIQVL